MCLFLVVIVVGVIIFGGYKLFVEKNEIMVVIVVFEIFNFIFINFIVNIVLSLGVDFIDVVNKIVYVVVYVKNIIISI